MNKEDRIKLNPVIGSIRSNIYIRHSGFFKSPKEVLEVVFKKKNTDFPNLEYSQSNISDLLELAEKSLKRKVKEEEKLYSQIGGQTNQIPKR